MRSHYPSGLGMITWPLQGRESSPMGQKRHQQYPLWLAWRKANTHEVNPQERDSFFNLGVVPRLQIWGNVNLSPTISRIWDLPATGKSFRKQGWVLFCFPFRATKWETCPAIPWSCLEQKTHSVLEFWPTELWANKWMLLQTINCMVFCYTAMVS